MKYTIIKNKAQYITYCDKIMNLTSVKKPNKEIENEIALLELLIDKWDKEHYKPTEKSPIELLKYLMENRGMSRNDLMEILGLSKGAISQILNYKKGLSKNVIRKLADTFKVSQEAFNRPYPLTVEVNKGHKNEKMMNTKKVLELV
jgi:HTH-type transcriptional regulator/antitoxin HigA